MKKDKKDCRACFRLSGNEMAMLKRMSSFYDKSMSSLISEMIHSMHSEMTTECYKKGIDITKIDDGSET